MPSLGKELHSDEITSNNRGDILGSFGGDTEPVIRGIETGEISEPTVVAEGEEKTNWFIWLLVCCCAISGLLFGEYKLFPVSH